MRAAILVLLAASAGSCTSCTAKPAPPARSATQIYTELVDGGCLLPSDSGAVSVQAEIDQDATPAWFTCMRAGGAVASCGAPCGDAGP